MEINQRMFKLFEITGKKEADLARTLEIGTGQISTWKTRNTDPPAKYLTRICEFFNVEPEFLLTGQEPLPKELTSEQQELLSLWDKLDPLSQAEIKGYIKGKTKTDI